MDTPGRRLATFLPPLLLLLVLLSLVLNLHWVFLRPVVLAFGRTTTVSLDSPMSIHTRRGFSQFDALANYAYSPDLAPTVLLPISRARWEQLQREKRALRLPAHYLAACPSCVVLDDDGGWALQHAVYMAIGLVFLLFAARTKRGA